MLLAINDRIKGWLGIAVVVLITLPFALWGIGEYFSDSGPRYAAKVNGSEISLNEYERAVSMQRRNLLNENNGKLPISDKLLREQTLKQLVNTRLLEGESFENGYRVSDSLLGQQIKQLFTVDGQFDRTRFESVIASLGMTVPMYEQTLRNELRVQQLQSVITNTTFITDEQLRELAALSNQTRDLTMVTFNLDVFSKADAPTDEEIKAYYEANQSNFMTPEQIRLDYVEITSDSIAANMQVDEEELRRMYEDYVAELSSREERKASHILVSNTGEDASTASQRIEEIREKLEAGEDFATLAKEYSEDPGSAQNGGDLGWVQIGDMVKPFENALFEMQPGGVSDIVETQFGYHLIKLDDIRTETADSFEMKRYQFEDELKRDAVASEFYDLSERLVTLSYENPDSLDVVVEEMGLPLKTTDAFGRFNGEGIASNEKVRNIAFSPLVMEQGSNSDIIEISPDHAVVVRMNEYQPARPMPLQEVSERIEKIIKVQKGHEQTVEAALAAKARLEDGEPVDALQADGVTIKRYKDVARNDRQQINDAYVLREAFKLSKEGEKPVIARLDLVSGDVALLMLDKVNVPEELTQNELELVRSEWVRDAALRDVSAMMLAFKNQADIQVNKRLNSGEEDE
jgi:peptidyl-prolyl cis-trans isomerase D